MPRRSHDSPQPEAPSSTTDKSGSESSPEHLVRPPSAVDVSEVEVDHLLANWQRNQDELRALFRIYRNGTDIPIGEDSERDFDKVAAKRTRAKSGRTIVYLSYENPWGRSGGIEAVARMLPREMQEVIEQQGRDDKIIRLSLLHSKQATEGRLNIQPGLLEDAKNHEDTWVSIKGEKEQFRLLGTCDVSWEPDGDPETVEVYRFRRAYKKDPIKYDEWVLIHAQRFFNADGEDCYTYLSEIPDRAHRDGEESLVLRDSLFAVKAIPEVLKEVLGETRNLVLHAQDWQWAGIALTAREKLLVDPGFESASVVLTMHNPYDHCFAIKNLWRVTQRTGFHQWPAVNGEPRGTLLSRMIPLLDAPPSTVSRVMALELMQCPLQTGHFAGHYQEALKKRGGVAGIDNGLFDSVETLDNSFKAYNGKIGCDIREAVHAARQGNPDRLLAFKTEARTTMLRVLEVYLEQVRDRSAGTLRGEGNALSKLPENVPIFLMVGRLDPGQKGFDLLCRVINRLPRGYGRFIISPLSPLADDVFIRRHLDDLNEMATARDGEVVVMPFRLAGQVELEGFPDPVPVYPALRAGVTWSLWPSIYEPFGGVSEFYLCLTPVVAHGVGGLREQVIDVCDNPDEATGIVFRSPPADILEDPSLSAQGREDLYLKLTEEHRMVQRADYPLDRMRSGLYSQQVTCFEAAIVDACTMYGRCRDDYGRMLGNLPAMAEKLSWRTSVRDYFMLYDKACE